MLLQERGSTKHTGGTIPVDTGKLTKVRNIKLNGIWYIFRNLIRINDL